MLGVDISELLVVLAVVLLVVGPERLPRVARTLGHLWGRAQRYVNSVKADISRDLAMEEVRQLRQQVQQQADEAGQAMQQAAGDIERDVRQIGSSADWPDASRPEMAGHVQQTAPVQEKFPVD